MKDLNKALGLFIFLAGLTVVTLGIALIKLGI
jgi:hypothetical protein